MILCKLDELPSTEDLKRREAVLDEAWRELSLTRLETRWQELHYELSSLDRFELCDLIATLDKSKPLPDKLQHTLDSIPLWGTTMLSARASFPLKPNLFDLIVVDEASQADLISALPLLYRSSRVAIIGDPMQA